MRSAALMSFVMGAGLMRAPLRNRLLLMYGLSAPDPTICRCSTAQARGAGVRAIASHAARACRLGVTLRLRAGGLIARHDRAHRFFRRIREHQQVEISHVDLSLLQH